MTEFAHFHFIRPLWLIAFIGIFISLYLIKKLRLSQSGWQQFLPPHLAKILLEGQSGVSAKTQNNTRTLIRPTIIGVLSVIALAGPTWQQLPQPVYQVERGSVLIMDMSYSMYATDLLPNRLTRARYKANDLLEQLGDGDIGLIAYAGDAFIISPLTQDINNIKLLLPSLTPDIMPELGSNPISALILANDMLKNSGHIEGDIYWFTDGIDAEDIQDITQWSRDHPHHLNILGIGSLSGAPIKLPNGELLKDDTGAIVVPKLSESYLQGAASRGKGVYRTIANDISDINELLRLKRVDKELKNTMGKESKNLEMGDQWKEVGPYLLWIILPLVLSYFRRGSMLVILPFCFFLFHNPPALASTWQDLWKTKDQQAVEKFDQQDFQAAAQLFDNPKWRGSAYYKAQDYENALKAFKQDDSASGLYNQGNALAQLQQIDEAIDAYKKALEIDPDLADAKENKEKLEALKKEQEQEKQQQDGDGDSQDKQEGDKEKQENSDQNKDQQGQNSQDKGDQSQDNDQQQKSDQNNEPSDESKDKQNASEQDDKNSKENEKNKEQLAKDEDEDEENKQQSEDEKQAALDKESKDKPPSDEATMAANLAEKLAQEKAEKHQQILNKVTDDPYLLLRNKMQIEYQNRRQDGHSSGVTKKW